jgi:hypothetical protein
LRAFALLFPSIGSSCAMFRSWTWWITLLLLSASLGYFWILSQDLKFVRVEVDKAQVKPK